MQITIDPRGDALRVLDDDELLHQVRTGDLAAFDVLYRRHVEWARRTARWHLRSSQAADDVVSEAFTATLRALQHGRGPREGFRAYLRACIRNQCNQQRRRGARATVAWVDGSDYDRSDRPAPDHTVTTSPIATAFAKLNPRWQHALILTAVHELDPAEAAAQMGICTNAMNALTHRAREALATAYIDAHLEHAAAGCSQVAAKYARYVRGHATPREIDAVDIHLATCASCTGAINELRDLNQTLRTLPLIPACPPLVAAAVGLSWTAKLTLIAGIVATTTAITTDQPPTRPTTATVTTPSHEPSSAHTDASNRSSSDGRSDERRDNSGGNGNSGQGAVGAAEAIGPNTSGGAATGTPTETADPSASPDETIGQLPDLDHITPVVVEVEHTPIAAPATLTTSVGGIVDLVTDLTGINPNAPIVNGTVSVDSSGMDASIVVDVAGINAGVDIDVNLDPTPLAPILPLVTVPISLPPITAVPVTVPTLPPLLRS